MKIASKIRCNNFEIGDYVYNGLVKGFVIGTVIGSNSVIIRVEGQNREVGAEEIMHIPVDKEVRYLCAIDRSRSLNSIGESLKEKVDMMSTLIRKKWLMPDTNYLLTELGLKVISPDYNPEESFRHIF